MHGVLQTEGKFSSTFAPLTAYYGLNLQDSGLFCVQVCRFFEECADWVLVPLAIGSLGQQLRENFVRHRQATGGDSNPRSISFEETLRA